jgi:hypothetical protein
VKIRKKQSFSTEKKTNDDLAFSSEDEGSRE